MANCPRCGRPFGEGSTRCWNSDCVNADRIDWQTITDRAVAINHHLRRRNLSVDLFTVTPPVDEKQVTKFNSKSKFKLPADFARFVTKHTGGWRFHWSLYNLKDQGQSEPECAPGSTGGNSEVMFIGASADHPLLTIHKSFQKDIRYSEVAESTLNLLPALFPLYTYEEGGADYTVLRLDRDPAEVVYLDHEFDYEIKSEHVLEKGFALFLRKWSNMGFPSCQHLQNGRLDDSSEQNTRWWAWLESQETA